MSIFVIGINHKTAPIALRERIYFAADRISFYLQDLLGCTGVQEAVLLSTCNRSEIYCNATDLEATRDWFYAQTSLPHHLLESALYVYRDEEAVAHIMQVACGLDSMILGEPQVLGQMKEAFSESCAAGMVGTVFHRLFQQIFTIAKEIRTTTAIGACPVSVASAAVRFAKQQIPAFAESSVALIGAGDVAQLLMSYLKSVVYKPLMIVNRNIDRALLLAQETNSEVFGLDQVMPALCKADVVFSTTGSATPIIQPEMMAQVMEMRLHRPLMFVDIAVPRDIDPAVAALAHVKLYCIDDLKAMIESNRQGREHAAEKAREMIRQKSIECMAELKSIDTVSHTIRAYRGQIEDICDAELLKAKQQLQHGADPVKVLDEFAYAFTKKLLHTPSVQLRQAGVEGRFELLHFAKQLFAIPDVEAESL